MPPCDNCGTDVDESATFCPNCGEPQDSDTRTKSNHRPGELRNRVRDHRRWTLCAPRQSRRDPGYPRWCSAIPTESTTTLARVRSSAKGLGERRLRAPVCPHRWPAHLPAVGHSRRQPKQKRTLSPAPEHQHRHQREHRHNPANTRRPDQPR
jgi:hypothetical protein